MSQSNTTKYGPVSLREISERCNFYQAPELAAAYPNGYSMRTNYTGFSRGSFYYMAAYGCIGPTGSGTTGMGDLSLLKLGRTFSYEYPTAWTCSPRHVTQPGSASAARTNEGYYSYDGAGSGTSVLGSEGGSATITANISSGTNPGARYITGYFYAHPELTKVRHIHHQLKNTGTVTGSKVGVEMIAYSSGYLAGTAQTLIEEWEVNTNRVTTRDANMVSGKRYVVVALSAWCPGAGKSSWAVKHWQVGAL